jgi:hypothetical protein
VVSGAAVASWLAVASGAAGALVLVVASGVAVVGRVAVVERMGAASLVLVAGGLVLGEVGVVVTAIVLSKTTFTALPPGTCVPAAGY